MGSRVAVFLFDTLDVFLDARNGFKQIEMVGIVNFGGLLKESFEVANHGVVGDIRLNLLHGLPLVQLGQNVAELADLIVQLEFAICDTVNMLQWRSRC